MSDETQVLPEQTTEQVDAPVVETAVEEPKVHPSWEKMLAELPEAWHGKVAPFLIENDKNVQAQLEKFTPFKEFVEEGLTPELIRGGLNLANAINENPAEVYSSLKNYLGEQGLLPEEAAAAAKDIMENESGDDIDEIFDGERVPKALQKEIDALRAKTEEIASYKEEQELAKATAEATATLEADMAALRSKHSITEAHETAIYDLMSAAIAAGRDMSVAEAAQQLSAMIGGFAPIAREEAPVVIGSSGGAGVPAPDLSIPKDSEGKRAMLQQMFADYQKQAR